MTLLRNFQVRDSTLSFDFFNSTDLQFENLKGIIGQRPSDLDTKFDAPDLKLALFALVSKLKLLPQEVHNLINTSITPLPNSLQSVLTEAKVSSLIEASVSQPDSQISALYDFSTKLASEISNHLSTLPSAPLRTSSNPQFETHISSLESEVKLLLDSKDTKAILYGGLMFKAPARIVCLAHSKFCFRQFLPDGGLSFYDATL